MRQAADDSPLPLVAPLFGLGERAAQETIRRAVAFSVNLGDGGLVVDTIQQIRQLGIVAELETDAKTAVPVRIVSHIKRSWHSSLREHARKESPVAAACSGRLLTA